MGWNYLLIFFVIALVVCLCGFYRDVYFLSVGCGLSAAAIGIAMIIMSAFGVFQAGIPHYILLALLIVYGVRLSVFYLWRDFKNDSYRRMLMDLREEGSLPVFAKAAVWIVSAALFAAAVSPAYFRLYNGGKTSVTLWIGIVICALSVMMETAADFQKNAQKKTRPDMVAMKGLYKTVRFPNYLAEILFFTGILISGLGSFRGAGQWILSIAAYLFMVLVIFLYVRRLEKRQMKTYRNSAAYKRYVETTPILIPVIPLYHLNKQQEKKKY